MNEQGNIAIYKSPLLEGIRLQVFIGGLDLSNAVSIDLDIPKAKVKDLIKELRRLSK